MSPSGFRINLPRFPSAVMLLGVQAPHTHVNVAKRPRQPRYVRAVAPNGQVLRCVRQATTLMACAWHCAHQIGQNTCDTLCTTQNATYRMFTGVRNIPAYMSRDIAVRQAKMVILSDELVRGLVMQRLVVSNAELTITVRPAKSASTSNASLAVASHRNNAQCRPLVHGQAAFVWVLVPTLSVRVVQ